MQIIWLGHGSFRIEIEDQVLLVDPWIAKNPMLAKDQAEAALHGATQILITHGHFDHTSDVVAVSQQTKAPVHTNTELHKLLSDQGALVGQGFNFGGTLKFGAVSVTLVPASHSSSLPTKEGARYAGTQGGFIIKGEGQVIYMSGDTGIMADMDWIGDYFQPDIGILSCGGHYTMDMAQAAYAAKRYFDFKTVIPCHYRTFPLLEQSAKALVEGLPGVAVIEPQVLQPIQL